MTYEESKRQMMRPPARTAEEIQNCYLSRQDWEEDYKIYCMTHCRVYDGFEEYKAEVEKELRWMTK